MLSSILHGLAFVKSGVLSILMKDYAPTTPVLHSEISRSIVCGSLWTCDPQSECCMIDYKDTAEVESGSTSTQRTPVSSSTLSKIDDESWDLTAHAMAEWANALKHKYGISQPLEKE